MSRAGRADTDTAGTIALAVRLFSQTAGGEKLYMALGLFLVLCASGAALLQPWPLKLILDSVVGSHPAPSAFSRLANTAFPSLAPSGALLACLCIAILLVQIVIGALNVLSTYVLVSIGLRMVFRLRCALFDHTQRLSLSFHDATSVGDSLYRVTWDTYCAQSLFNSGIVPAISAAVSLAGITLIMLRMDVAVTLAALAICIPLALVIRWLDRPMTERSLVVHERESDISTRVQETLWGIRAVQAFVREAYESARFRDQASKSLVASLRLNVLQTGSQALVGFLLAAGTALVVWLGVGRAVTGQLTPGDVVLLTAYVAMLYKPLETLTYTAATVQGAMAGARRVFAILDAAPEVLDTDDAVELPAHTSGRIVFDEVSFGYEPGRPVLQCFSLDIPAGSTIALVGASGAGKTTIASLLLRFYDPTAGRITLDGQDLSSLLLGSLRRNIAVVPQEPVLFCASVRENIAYARPGATPEEIEAAAQAAGAHEFIQNLPEGYGTQLGERGVTLSGGQRQRLSIARAFLKDAPVLIMDEPTSALDAETEARLLRSLADLTRGRTTIIIAHRLSTIRSADQIVVLRQGEIAERGSYRDLLDRGGLFRRLYESQQGIPEAKPDAATVTASDAGVTGGVGIG